MQNKVPQKMHEEIHIYDFWFVCNKLHSKTSTKYNALISTFAMQSNIISPSTSVIITAHNKTPIESWSRTRHVVNDNDLEAQITSTKPQRNGEMGLFILYHHHHHPNVSFEYLPRNHNSCAEETSTRTSRCRWRWSEEESPMIMRTISEKYLYRWLYIPSATTLYYSSVHFLSIERRCN